MKDSPPPLYSAGDYVFINQIYILKESLRTVRLDKSIVARVLENKGPSSLGYAYVLDIPPQHKPNNIANVCYWESDILCKTENPDEYLWKVWGDQ